jgi:hypothetical protein
LNRRDQVEPQSHEVDEIVARQRLASKVRVDQPQTAEPAFRRAQAPDVRENELRRIANDDVVDLSGPVNENTDLPPGLERNRSERSRQLGGGDVVGRNTTPVEALEGAQSRRRQAVRVSVDLNDLDLARVVAASAPPRRGYERLAFSPVLPLLLDALGHA